MAMGRPATGGGKPTWIPVALLGVVGALIWLYRNDKEALKAVENTVLQQKLELERHHRALETFEGNQQARKAA